MEDTEEKLFQYFTWINRKTQVGYLSAYFYLWVQFLQLIVLTIHFKKADSWEVVEWFTENFVTDCYSQDEKLSLG